MLSDILTEMHRPKMESDELGGIRAWKLFVWCPSCCFTVLKGLELLVGVNCPTERRSSPADIGGRQLNHFCGIRQSNREVVQNAATQKRERRGKAAQAKVQRGQVYRSRHELTGAGLAPKNETTLQALRARRPQEQVRPIPQDVLEFVPIPEVNLNANLFATCLRAAPSGSFPRLGGCTHEMLKVCLDNTEAVHLLTSAAEDFARSSVPDCIFKAFTMATMTALRKPDGGIRNQHVFSQIGGQDIGHAVHVGRGESLRAFPIRFVHPYGDCVGHAVRVVTDHGGGVGSANMEEENKGTPRPQKFRKAIHNAQTEVKVLPFEGEFLFAFLDDIKVLAKPGSIREVYGLLGEPH